MLGFGKRKVELAARSRVEDWVRSQGISNTAIFSYGDLSLSTLNNSVTVIGVGKQGGHVVGFCVEAEPSNDGFFFPVYVDSRVAGAHKPIARLAKKQSGNGFPSPSIQSLMRIADDQVEEPGTK